MGAAAMVEKRLIRAAARLPGTAANAGTTWKDVECGDGSTAIPAMPGLNIG